MYTSRGGRLVKGRPAYSAGPGGVGLGFEGGLSLTPNLKLRNYENAEMNAKYLPVLLVD
jgi:hypothetical protein